MWLKKILTLLFCLLFVSSTYAAFPPVNWLEQDGSPSVFPTKVRFPNDSLSNTATGLIVTFVSQSDADLRTVFTAMTEPSGFVDRVATLSFVDATRVFTITGDHDIYINGVKTTKGTASITIDDATGMNWVYYNASGVLSQTTSQPSFALPLIVTVYYNTVTDKGLLGEERHGIKMDGDTHHLLHNTVGTRYESGLAGTFADSTFSIALGTINDEDLEHTITPAKTTCNVLYKDGAADFKWLAGQTKYYYEDIGSDLNYNNGNVLTPLGANQYMAVWIFATNDTTTPIVSLIGQRTDANIADARANNKYESLTLGTLPFQEMKLLYRVILRNDATPYEEAQDLRNISNLPAGTYVATDHGVLTGLTDDDHPQYWVDSSVATRATNYATTGTLDFGGATSVKVPNAADLTLDTAGEVGVNTTHKGFAWYDGTQEVFQPSIHTLQGSLGTGDYDSDSHVKILDLDADVFPHGIVITKWSVSANEADPTTELAGDLMYCDDQTTGAFPGANPVLIDVLDTTTGNSSESTMANSDLTSGIIPSGKTIYILIDSDLVSDTTLFSVKINFYIPES